jgi:hypothetical protein
MLETVLLKGARIDLEVMGLQVQVQVQVGAAVTKEVVAVGIKMELRLDKLRKL